MTKRENFEAIKAMVVGNEELTAFIDHELELLDRKYSSKSENKVQKENKIIVDMLIDILSTSSTPMTVTDILAIDSVADYITVEGKALSNQKISRLLNDAVKAGSVVKTTDKKKSYFSV